MKSRFPYRFPYEHCPTYSYTTCLRVHSAAAINHWATHYIIYKMWISAGLLAPSENHGENILNPCHEVKRQKQRCSHINWVAATPPPDCVSEVFNKHV